MKRKIIPFDAAAEGLLVSNKKNTTRRGKEGVSQTVRYYEQLVLRLGKIKCTEKEWFIYQPKLGIWQLRKKESLFPAAIDVINREQQNSKLSAELLNFTWQKSQLQEGEKLYGAIRYDEDPNYFLIKCPSRILKIHSRTGDIVEGPKFHSKWNFTSSLGVDYNPNATCPIFLQTLKQIQPDKLDRILLMNFSALILVPHSKHECALLCIGEGLNGKGVFWDAIENVLGEENVTHVTLSQICHNDRKHVHRMKRALLNNSTETDSRKIFETTALKQIISGEKVATDQIYQEGYEMQTNCKIASNQNNVPSFAGGSNAEPRRFKIVYFGQDFTATKDMNLRDHLKIEGEGILKLIISRLKIVLGLTDIGYGGKASRQMHSNFTIRNNPVKAFVDCCMNLNPPPGSYELRDSVWKAYREFAEDNNIRIDYETKDETFKRMYQYKPELRSKQIRRMINGQQRYVINGVKLL